MQHSLQILRSGFFALPLIGSAHAARFDYNHGFGLEMDRAAGDASVWLGRWEIHVTGRRGVGIAMALPVLMAGAMLVALASLPKVSRA